MALIVLVIATATSVAATGRLTVPLLLSGIVCWSFVPALQLLTGLLFLRGSRVDPAHALAAYFSTHRPWLLWLLIVTGTLLLLPDPGRVLLWAAATAVVPAVLTLRALTRFATDVFGDVPSRARRRVALHQGVTLVLVIFYVDQSVALWPRIAWVLGR